MAENEVNKTHTVSQSPMKRYFLITGRATGIDEDMVLETNGIFPSRTLIEKEFLLQSGHVLNAILNIFEFQSETDYNQFIRE